MKGRLQKTYRHAIEILEQVGIRLKHDGVLDILKEKRIRIEGELVYFSKKDIESWISKAPSSFTKYIFPPGRRLI